MTETVEVPRALIEAGNWEAIKKLLPRPTGLLGRWGHHPEYGRVMCIQDWPECDGKVPVALVSGGETFTEDVDYHELDLDPVELVTEKDFMEAPAGTVVIKHNFYPRTCDSYGYWENEPGYEWLPSRMAENGPWQVLRWGCGDE